MGRLGIKGLAAFMLAASMTLAVCAVAEGPRRIKTAGIAPSEEGGTAYAESQSLRVDGVEFPLETYALKENGTMTNYVKIRDVAFLLNGSQAKFEVGYDKAVYLTSGLSYTVRGVEMTTPFSGDRAYTVYKEPTVVDGEEVLLDAFVIHDDAGNGYTYYRLRDLGKALGFNVGWTAQRGIFIETGKPYTDED